MNTFWQDVRYGIRMMGKHRGFTLVAILTLGLGIGANTAIFSVINGVILRPLPFHEPEGLLSVVNVDLKNGDPVNAITWPDFIDYRAQNQSFAALAAYDARDLTLTGVGESVRLRGAMVTSDLFPMLGLSPQLGRGFTPEEEKPGSHVALLGQGFWRRRFNGDPNVLGRTIGINGRNYSIIGVMPAGVKFPLDDESVELWINAAIDAEGAAPLTAQRGNHTIEAIGRLKPGVPLAAAQAEMGRIAAGLAKQYETNTDFGATAFPYQQRLVGDAGKALLLLLGAVGCILLIACANVANLLLARAAARQREIAIRAAMGAGRARIILQLLTESLVLSLLGGAAGILLAWWGTEWLLGLIPKGLPRGGDIAMDLGVLGFTLLLSLGTGIVFGLAPAMQTARIDLTESLKDGSRSLGGSARGSRLRNSLVVGQIAIAFVLLVAAGLLFNSFLRLQQVNPGFDPKNLLSFRISLPGTRYAEPARAENFYRQLLAKVQAMPGVLSVSAITTPPLSGQNAYVGFAIEGIPTEASRPFPHETNLRIAHTGYLRTMGIGLLQGRDFAATDAASAPPVVLINETLARKHFPNQNPIGRRINPSFSTDDRGILWREIVGVVRDVRHASLAEEAGNEVYVPYAQAVSNTLSVVARTGNDPQTLIPSIRKEVQALDKDLPVYAVKTMEEYMTASIAPPRFNMLLLSIFAGVALLMTAVGLYGVMGYTVSQRTNEIGIRMALGAQSGAILGMVLKQAMRLTLLGLAIGLAGALAATQMIAAYLFNTRPTDLMTYAAIAFLLALVALIASLVPARRASRVDPLIALRNE